MSQDTQTAPAREFAVDVKILHEGTWFNGILDHWRDEGARLTGHVRWSSGPGQLRIGWYDKAQIRHA
jgi:hypothetical protein